MAYKKICLDELNINPFTKIGKDWMLITAISDGVVNTMTASWGNLGVLWNKNVATAYIRPQRYTKQFVDSSDYFTLTFFDGFKKELGILGTHSGMECDKIKDVGFKVEFLENQPTFKQGSVVVICKKIYQDHLKKDLFLDDEIDKNNYPNQDYHHFYIGEIISVYINK